MPPIVNPDRREACRLDLLLFLATYFPHSTGLSPFSPDHERVIARIQRCILDFGQFVEAVYRGFAKTTICENSTIWATVYGHRRFVVLIGADSGAADDNLDSIKMEFEENDLLLEDFPEMVWPILCLEGRHQRAATQGYDGMLTRIEWTTEHIVMPRMPDPFDAELLAPGSNTIIKPKGLTASGIRGMKHKIPGGEQVRPDFVICDDPQTDQSADSAYQCHKRLMLIKKAIIRGAGHVRRLSIVVPATIIQRDDLVAQLMDRKLHPTWQSEKIPMVKEFADAHDKFWLETYAQVRQTFDPDDPADQERAHRAATKLYADNRKTADAGAKVSWESCFDPHTELSAIQHAYNILLDDGPEVFATECQCDPDFGSSENPRLTWREIAGHINGFARGIVPAASTVLTGHIDVHDKLLYWVVCAWGEYFKGWVVDYGTYPDQGRRYFSLKSARISLRHKEKGADIDGALYAGLEKLSTELLERVWKRSDGTEDRLRRLLIDAGHNASVVRDYRRSSPFGAMIWPTFGRGILPSDRPITEWTTHKGAIKGLNWFITPPKKVGRDVLFDTNRWKTHVHDALGMPVGNRSSLTLYKETVEHHRLFGEQAAAEFFDMSESHGRERRTMQVWHLPSAKPDNHLWDNLVNCAVGASIEGIRRVGLVRRKAKKRRVPRKSTPLF